MNLTPELVQYGAAEDIQIRPFAFIKPGATATVIPVSNVDGFVVAQTVYIENVDGTFLPTTGEAGAVAISAIDPVAKTITVATTTTAAAAGGTLVGPVLLSLGGTDGGIKVSIKPENETVQYDQVEGDVEMVPVHFTCQVDFTLKEFGLDQWGLLSQLGYSARNAATGVTAANLISLGIGLRKKYGVRFQIPKTDPSSSLKDFLTLYKVRSIEGLEYEHAKRTPSQLPVRFHVLADPVRARGARFGQMIQETAPASA